MSLTELMQAYINAANIAINAGKVLDAAMASGDALRIQNAKVSYDFCCKVSDAAFSAAEVARKS